MELSRHSYLFKFQKKTILKNIILSKINSSGQFNFSMNFDNQQPLFIFQNEGGSQDGVKESLSFDTVKWSYIEKDNLFQIDSKDELEIKFKEYKDKHRRAENISVFLMIERLYFHTPLGLEYSMLSNGPYTPFLNMLNRLKLEKGQSYKQLSLILVPLSIPVEFYLTLEKEEENLSYYRGTVTLDEETLTKIVADKNFKDKGKSYHYSRDFSIESDYKIIVDNKTGYITSCVFWMKIYSKNEALDEEIQFEVSQVGIKNSLKFEQDNKKLIIETDVFKVYKGKSYTESEWIAFEKELWQDYKKENKIISEEDAINKKESLQGGNLGFFLDEKKEI